MSNDYLKRLKNLFHKLEGPERTSGLSTDDRVVLTVPPVRVPAVSTVHEIAGDLGRFEVVGVDPVSHLITLMELTTSETISLDPKSFELIFTPVFES